jgi:hypothetical protein
VQAIDTLLYPYGQSFDYQGPGSSVLSIRIHEISFSWELYTLVTYVPMRRLQIYMSGKRWKLDYNGLYWTI